MISEADLEFLFSMKRYRVQVKYMTKDGELHRRVIGIDATNKLDACTDVVRYLKKKYKNYSQTIHVSATLA